MSHDPFAFGAPRRCNCDPVGCGCGVIFALWMFAAFALPLLKLCGDIDLDWSDVLAPIWVPALFCALLSLYALSERD